MKTRWLVGLLILLIVMNVAAIGTFVLVQLRNPRAPVGWSPPDMRGDGERPLEHLSQTERRKVFQAMREFHDQIRDLNAETHNLEADAIASMNQDPVPRAHIDSLLQQIADNRLEIARRATDRLIAMRETLTPEEREHLMTAIMNMRGGGPGDRPRNRTRHRP